MYQSDNVNELAAALSKAQGMMEAATANQENPFFKSSYANLNDVWNVCRAPLSSNGLAILQAVGLFEDGYALHTTLTHSSGQWFRSVYPLKPVKPDPQSFGACVTYARRFSLAALVGVSVTESDDDGNDAAARPAQQSAQPKTQPKQATPAVTSASYVVKIGRHAGKTVADIGEASVRDALASIEESRVKNGGKLPDDWAEVQMHMAAFIAQGRQK